MDRPKEVYCAICGGPTDYTFLRQSYLTDEFYRREGGYDPAILEPDDVPKVRWLADVGEIWEDKMFDQIGEIRINRKTSLAWPRSRRTEPPSSDPNLFQGDTGPYSQLYNAEYSAEFLFHCACYRLLCKAVGVEDLVKQVFRDTLKDLSPPDRNHSALYVDYGPVRALQRDPWVISRGTEYVMISPLDVPGVSEYFEAIPRPWPVDATLRSVSTNGAFDPLYRFPPETRLWIMSHVSISSIGPLKAASRAMQSLELGPSFWRRRVQSDMPWLYEFPQAFMRENPRSIDWLQVYKNFHAASRQGSGMTIHGLANRRRIWETSIPRIVRSYLERMAGAGGENNAVIVQDARLSICPRLTLPEPNGAWKKTGLLIQAYQDLTSASPRLIVHWTPEGYLSSLNVQDGNVLNETQSTSFGSAAHTTDTIDFPDDDWLTGFIVATRDQPCENPSISLVRNIVGLEILFAKQDPITLGDIDGDKRLIHIEAGRFVAAIRTYHSSEGRICRIGLLHQPCTRAPGVDRVIQRRVPPNLGAISLLWRQGTPPSPLEVNKPSKGAHLLLIDREFTPMDYLVFGDSEEELADITAVYADVRLGGFMVTYGNLPTRTLGPALRAMIRFDIDGHGGERIVRMKVAGTDAPGLIKLITNRNRQLVVGYDSREQYYYLHKFQLEEHYPDGHHSVGMHSLAGLYAFWKNGELGDATPGAVAGLLMAPLIDRELPVLVGGHVDLRGNEWQPAPPTPQFCPEAWLPETNNSWRELRDIVYMKTAIIRWLDCSRPVLRVHATLCHSTEKPQLQLVSLGFVYADGDKEDSTAGPSLFPPPPEGTQSWCRCVTASSGPKVREEVNSLPHYEHKSWEVGGSRLGRLRVWSSKTGGTGGLLGLQFCSAQARTVPFGHARLSHSVG